MTDLRPNSEIAEGVHWIKDRYVNNYIIDKGEDLILVDTALNKRAKAILPYIKVELESKPISKILMTHRHEDHTGGLKFLNEAFKPHIYASEIDGSVIRGESKVPAPESWTMKPLFLLMKLITRRIVVQEVKSVVEGDVIDGFEVVSLPGHTEGSLGFKMGDLFFVGDAATQLKNGEIGLGSGKLFATSRREAKNTLLKIDALEFNTMLPGHGNPILEGAQSRTVRI